MNDDQLKQAWQRLASDKEKLYLQSPNLRMNMEREINKFEKRVNTRDRKEIITAICLLFSFTVLAFVRDGYQRIASICLVGYFIWVIYYLASAKIQQPTFSISKSIKEQMIEYRSYVLLQQRLIKNVLYWYILPIIPGILFFCMSLESSIAIAVTVSTSLLIFIYIYRLNQRAAKENYDHLLQDLNHAIQSLEV